LSLNLFFFTVTVASSNDYGDQGYERQGQSRKMKTGHRGRWPKHLQHIHLNAAGIDVGTRSHFVAVPEGRDTASVREFCTFTGDLEQWAD
jgi:hypothetical protein